MKLGRTDLVQNVNVRIFGGTDSLISVGPKRYERETESLHCNLDGTDRSSRLTEMLRRETERLQSHLGETEIPIGETKKTRVSGSGYVN